MIEKVYEKFAEFLYWYGRKERDEVFSAS